MDVPTIQNADILKMLEGKTDVNERENTTMELLHGAPADMTGRSDREKRAYAFLDKLGIEYDRTDHPDRPATTMEVCADVDAILGIHICKNLFLRNRKGTEFYLLVMPGEVMTVELPPEEIG